MIFDKKGESYQCTGYCDLFEKDTYLGTIMKGACGFYMFFPAQGCVPIQCGQMNSITKKLSTLNHGISNGTNEKKRLHRTDVSAVQSTPRRV